jgi:hypothetical protein
MIEQLQRALATSVERKGEGSHIRSALPLFFSQLVLYIYIWMSVPKPSCLVLRHAQLWRAVAATAKTSARLWRKNKTAGVFRWGVKFLEA